MALREIALGLASLALGLHSVKKGLGYLSAPQQRQLNPRFQGGFMAAPVYQNPAQTRLPGTPFMSSGYRNVRMPNGRSIPMQMRSYNIRTLEDRINYLRHLVDAGKRDPNVFAFARRAVSQKCGGKWCTPEKDNLAEAKAVFGAVRSQNPQEMAAIRKLFKDIRGNVRYTSDIAGVDTYQRPSHTLALKTGDCLPADTKLLKSDGTLVTIEDVCVGDEIFDGIGWTKVTQWWDKGRLRVDAFELNNGCVLRCTKEHLLLVVPAGKNNASRPASSAVELCAKNVRPGDELLQPRELAFLEGEKLSYDEAFLLGVYLAEGSVRRERFYDTVLASVEIAGIPDAKGMREKAAACAERLGFKVSYLKRQLYISDKGERLHKLLAGCGHYAPEKKLPHVRWDKETAAAILEGLSADGGFATNKTNFVFSTTSARLAVQYRLLQRLFGKSTSIKKVDDHGGLGTHPIYRVTVRKDDTKRPWAKIRGIREAGSERVFDIETTSHRFYLPEQDIIVHNCDDFSSLTCASLQSIGIPCRFKVIRTKDANDWNHIWPQAGLPRANPTRWYNMDSSVNMPFGWEAPANMVAASKVFRVG